MTKAVASDSLTASERLDLLRREARKHKVGEVVEIAGEKLMRVDARKSGGGVRIIAGPIQ